MLGGDRPSRGCRPDGDAAASWCLGASPGGGGGGSIYVCSKGLIMERHFNVSRGLDETLKMLLLRKK